MRVMEQFLIQTFGSAHAAKLALSALLGFCVFIAYRRVLEHVRVRQRVAGVRVTLRKHERMALERALEVIPSVPLLAVGPLLVERARRIGWDVDEDTLTKVRAACMVACGILLVPIIGLPGMSIGALLGYYLPAMYINSRYNRRADELLSSFPIFVDYLRTYLAAGCNIPQALRRSAERMEGAMREEAMRLVAQMEVLGDYEQPFREFAVRLGFPHAHQLADALIHGWRTGLRTEVFEQQAQLVRDIKRMALRKAIRKAPVQLVAIPGSLAMANLVMLLGVPLFLRIVQQISGISGAQIQVR